MKPARLLGLRWTGFIPQLFVLTILPLTMLLLVIALGGTALHQDVMRDMAGEQSLRAARGTASALGESVRVRVDHLRSLAQRLQDGTELSRVLETSGYLEDEFDGGLLITSSSGEILSASPFPAGTGQVDPAGILAGLAENPEGFGAGVLPPVDENGLPLAVLSVPGSENTVVVGLFSPAALARRTLVGTYGPPHAGMHRQVTLFDPQAGLLYSEMGSMGGEEQPSQEPGVAEALRGETGITYLEIEGIEHVVAFSPVAPYGWALVIEEPWEAESGTLLRASQFTPLVLIPALLLALVGLWFGARQVMQPLRDLEKEASALAWGREEVDSPPVGGIEEIRRLQLTLREMARRVGAAQSAMRGYIGAITAGQEEERRRLAREIHDDTLQSIIALRQRAQLAAHRLDGHPASQNLAELDDLADEAISGLRRLLRGLRPSYLDELGLAASLEMLAKETAQAGGIQVAFQQFGEERRLKGEVELALYRMAQEALNNVLHHSQASQAWVEISYTPEQITLEVRDNGRGFPIPESPGEFAPAGHFGLLGLHERSGLIGANLELESAQGTGTKVRIILQNPFYT